MSQEAIRDALVAYVYDDWKTANPGIPLVTDNAPFDWNALPDKFVLFEISWAGGDQIGISPNPATRLRGHVYVTAYQRAGTGSKAALGILGWFAAKLKYQHIGLANLQAPEPRDIPSRAGFHMEQLAFYFYSDAT